MEIGIVCSSRKEYYLYCDEEAYEIKQGRAFREKRKRHYISRLRSLNSVFYLLRIRGGFIKSALLNIRRTLLKVVELASVELVSL